MVKAVKREVRYRALKKCFVGGVLREPGEEFTAEAGLEGPVMERIAERGDPARGMPVVEPADGQQ